MRAARPLTAFEDRCTAAPPAGRLRHLAGWARRDFLARSSALIMATTIITSALGAVYWVIAAHILPAHVVGLGAALVSAMTLAATLATLGTGPTVVQTIPGRRSGEEWSRALNACLAVSLGAALVAGGVALAVLPLLSASFAAVREPAYVLVLGAGVVVWAAGNQLDSAFIAERASGRMLVRNATASALKLAILAALVALGARGSLGLVVSWTASTTAALALAAFVQLPRLGRGYRPQVRGVAREARHLVTPFVGHSFITVGGIVPVLALPLLVTARLSATQNAYFYTTWMLCSMLFMVSPAVAAALFAEGSHPGVSVYAKARTATLIAGLLGAPMLVLALGGRLVLGLFGAAYAQHSYALLLLLVAAAVPDAVTNVYIVVLRVERRFRTASALNVSMGVGALVLGWLAMPALGIAGVGLAWLGMQTAGSLGVGLDLWLRRGRRRAPAAAVGPSESRGA
jgi:O-antigen/teichoic acid export membrane protein